ncbi:MAG: STAS/SEC14 domain-containing protein [Chloroflexi bacterium]|jgi:hypothetical protein|nr:STAS/SEC14 domain-containing protein [Chloroflexota bacterium]
MDIQLVKAIESMPLSDLDEFIAQALQIRARRIAPSFNKNEADLLFQIGQGLPPRIWRRYEALNQIKDNRNLSESEQSEMLDLSRQIEQYSFHRLQLMSQLANLRKVSLQNIADQLGVGMPKYV